MPAGLTPMLPRYKLRAAAYLLVALRCSHVTSYEQRHTCWSHSDAHTLQATGSGRPAGRARVLTREKARWAVSHGCSRDGRDVGVWNVKHEFKGAVASPQVLQGLRWNGSEGGGIDGSGCRGALGGLREEQSCVVREAGMPLQVNAPPPVLAHGRGSVVEGGLAALATVGGTWIHDRGGAVRGAKVEQLLHVTTDVAMEHDYKTRCNLRRRKFSGSDRAWPGPTGAPLLISQPYSFAPPASPGPSTPRASTPLPFLREMNLNARPPSPLPSPS